ncbi:pyrimidine/purine nucleoside phosphorylase [Enterococcus sp. AZ072]|uniref:pyrimidine/purine nucleoside phosphorylase n=1 Tax=unclassified Enterococcus TaxID=2608891 RepID=UPI003D2AE05B
MLKNVDAVKKANVYFDGKVTSRTLQQADGSKVTLGFMLAGDYTFNTNEKELMTVLQGAMTVLLPGETEWQTFTEEEEFIVPKNSAFQVKVTEYADYSCSYIAE